ncbi:hypothetical protein THRCLA_03734 [Thraustotheca clavata]|uniref:Uncharacterized protein n=1 Tax=Thraustotheca clavata TaxID=74557 RepID=A0A1W0A139_9STRA|nr:hypothetical protein THRCLA_03734 [Thraustotheca clavata]
MIYQAIMGVFGNIVGLLVVPGQEHEYYSSAFNLFQIPTYLAVLLYVLSEFVTIFTGDAQIYFGNPLYYGLEYLEVHPTAGFLLPMMRSMYCPLTTQLVKLLSFLVVIGQIDLNPFNNLEVTSYVLGYIILLTKTIDDVFEKSRIKAIKSFAECVLCCEKTNGLRAINIDAAKEIIKDLAKNDKERRL